MSVTPTPLFWLRILRIVLHTLTGLLFAACLLPLLSQRLRLGLIQWWCTRLLNCFNVQVSVSGHVPNQQTRGCLLVGNHISWADIHAINSVIPVRFVAKMEINGWPIFGYLARKTGTIFINRTKNRDAARVLNIAAQALKLQDNLCVFPEGTTSEGIDVLPFKSSLLQAAVTAECKVIPVTIRYPDDAGQPNRLAAYAGETSLQDSMKAYLNMRTPRVHLHFGEPVLAVGLSRQALAEQLQLTIASHLQTAHSLIEKGSAAISN